MASNSTCLVLDRMATSKSLIDSWSMLLGINLDHKPTFGSPGKAKRFIN